MASAGRAGRAEAEPVTFFAHIQAGAGMDLRRMLQVVHSEVEVIDGVDAKCMLLDRAWPAVAPPRPVRRSARTIAAAE